MRAWSTLGGVHFCPGKPSTTERRGPNQAKLPGSSGVAMRFPRINRLRWDKPPREADRLETLERMLKSDAIQVLAADGH